MAGEGEVRDGNPQMGSSSYTLFYTFSPENREATFAVARSQVQVPLPGVEEGRGELSCLEHRQPSISRIRSGIQL